MKKERPPHYRYTDEWKAKKKKIIIHVLLLAFFLIALAGVIMLAVGTEGSALIPIGLTLMLVGGIPLLLTLYFIYG